MEIIQHGREHKTLICECCGCKFSYTPVDVQKEDSCGIPGTIRCPECNHRISLW